MPSSNQTSTHPPIITMYHLILHPSAIAPGKIIGKGGDLTLRRRLANLIIQDRHRCREQNLPRRQWPSRCNESEIRFSNGTRCRLTFEAPVRPLAEIIPFPTTVAA